MEKIPVFHRRTISYSIIGATFGFLYASMAIALDHNLGIAPTHIHLFAAPVVTGIFGLVLGLEQDRIRAQAMILDIAQHKFSALTHKAITERNWDVSFHDAHVPTCWKVKSCTATECPSYGKENIRCWLVAGTYCRGEVQGRFAQKLGDCAKCQVYQEAVEHDPLNKIGENFNSLMWVLREKSEMLAVANDELQSQYVELEHLQRETRALADSDRLTGLKNHGHFQIHLKDAIDEAAKNQMPLSVVMLDLDHFKSVNDEFGHQKGDAVLSAVGRFLKENLRRDDYVARYGGEEFVIIMPGRKGKQATTITEQLREKIICISDETGLASGYVSGSFGIADFPECATEAGGLVAAADSALLFSKRKGRNRVAYFKDLTETELEDGDVERLHSRLRGAGLETIRALAEAVDESDQYSKDETMILSRVALGMAEKLGMEKKQADALELATRLHDIGKIGVPGAVLRKKEKLTSAELEQVQRHPVIGQQFVEEAKQMKELISGILYHHERWDGTGYPEKLKGEDIPITARVVGILDSYRAMRSDRPYRKAMTVSESIAELRKGAGSQFDPVLTEMFIDLLEQIESRELQQAV